MIGGGPKNDGKCLVFGLHVGCTDRKEVRENADLCNLGSARFMSYDKHGFLHYGGVAMLKKTPALLVTFVLLTIALAGCAAEEEATATPEPIVDVALKITGKVDNEMGWSEEEVRAMETMDTQSTNKKGETETYTGVSVNTLLESAGVQADASTIIFIADDGSTGKIPLAEVQACADCIISFRSQGGFSVVMPSFPSNVQVKEVIEIQAQ